MQLFIQSSKQLNSELKKQLLDLYDRFFPRPPSRPRRTRIGFYSSQKNRVRLMLVDGQKLISHAAVLTKSLNHAGRRYKLAGLGGVLTHPNHRNRGHGTQIVKKTTEYINRQDFDLAVLFCDKKRIAFYGRHGWEVLINNDIKVIKNKNPILLRGEVAMIRYISKRAKEDRELFKNQPIFFADYW